MLWVQIPAPRFKVAGKINPSRGIWPTTSELIALIGNVAKKPDSHKTLFCFLFKLCAKVCSFSDFLCWFCSGFYNIEDNNSSSNNNNSFKSEPKSSRIRLPTQADLIQKAKFDSRQRKKTGGVPVQSGDLPYIVRQVEQTLTDQCVCQSKFSFLWRKNTLA